MDEDSTTGYEPSVALTQHQDYSQYHRLSNASKPAKQLQSTCLRTGRSTSSCWLPLCQSSTTIGRLRATSPFVCRSSRISLTASTLIPLLRPPVLLYSFPMVPKRGPKSQPNFYSTSKLRRLRNKSRRGRTRIFVLRKHLSKPRSPPRHTRKSVKSSWPTKYGYDLHKNTASAHPSKTLQPLRS